MKNKMTSLRRLINDAIIIKFRDWSDYDPRYCNNGGSYMFGERLEHVDHNSWTFHETTSAEYCPYCHSFDCCGDCWEAEDYQRDLHSDMEVQWKLMEWMLLEEENPENYELLIEF